jgi:hypothetical protein
LSKSAKQLTQSDVVEGKASHLFPKRKYGLKFKPK